MDLIFLEFVAVLFVSSATVHVDLSTPVLVPRYSGPLSDTDPYFISPIQNVTVAVGREAVLSCAVSELGNYKVGWMKVDDQTILTLHARVITHNSRISVTNDNFRTWHLRIRQLKESDSGCYMCQINTSTMKKQIGCVDVQVPPDIDDEETSSDVTVQEGENATLVCKATGHPSPRILWRREDGDHLIFKKLNRDAIRVDTYSGDTLTLLKLDRKQMGAYLCIASNDVPPAVSKRITLNINFAPVVKVPNQLVGAPLGTDVQLECYVEAYPNTINYWLNNKGDMLLNGKKHTILEDRTGYKVHLSLIIRNISKRDLGTYKCAATNSLGRTDGSVRLYEIKVPTTPSTTTTEMRILTLQITEATTRAPAVVMEQRSAILATKKPAMVEALLEDPSMDRAMHPSVATLSQHDYMENYSSSSSKIYIGSFLLILLITMVLR